MDRAAPRDADELARQLADLPEVRAGLQMLHQVEHVDSSRSAARVPPPRPSCVTRMVSPLGVFFTVAVIWPSAAAVSSKPAACCSVRREQEELTIRLYISRTLDWRSSFESFSTWNWNPAGRRPQSAPGQ
jgi:hypothetical protein